MNDQHHENNQFWIGLFLGGLVGAFLIVIMGTEKGKKLAKHIQEEGLDFWDEAKEKGIDLTENLEEKGEDLIQKGKQILNEGQTLERQAMQTVAAVKENVSDEVIARADATLAHIEALQERGRQSTAELRKKLFKNIPKRPISNY